MENRLCLAVETALAAAFLFGEGGAVVYLKVCLPPFMECIDSRGGVVALHVSVNGPDESPNPVF